METKCRDIIYKLIGYIWLALCWNHHKDGRVVDAVRTGHFSAERERGRERLCENGGSLMSRARGQPIHEGFVNVLNQEVPHLTILASSTQS